ncbi:cyclodehydratase [Mycolicibacterium tusciae]|uniref:Cyclodehydratase n=1 Tax=Mycolicibacterium tusciae TaxID=75922 RepID=A0A1X0JW15_9MYCO|nr:cyclodehydratase [Mycolicibacterium tusciae]ORB67113.1 cyclodehydratase [Mycolicibacterium tusciae]
MAGYVLDPARPVLLRPDGAVQVGWDPRRAVLVRPPTGMTARTLADLLRRLQSGATLAQLDEHADGIGTHVVAELVSSLVDAAVVTSTSRGRTRAASIRIHGRGPLSDLLASALRCSGALITQSSRPHAGAPADLAVLTDFLVSDPRVVRDLHADGVPYLPVRVRDGVGLVGPLVLPGVTSCLECADLHRSDRDSAWPAVAAQLRDAVGSADRATVLATAALALNQVERVVRAVHGGLDMADTAEPPSTLNTTLEFDVNVGTIAARHWPRHPRCGC